jgi:hypothetical protein
MRVEGKAMTFKKVLITASAIGLLASAAGAPVGARGIPSQPTAVTFTRAVELPGMTLPAGRYVFERATPDTSANAVLIRGDHGRVQWLGLTNSIERRQPGKTIVQLSEVGPGEAPRVLTWFPSESTQGAAFIY